LAQRSTSASSLTSSGYHTIDRYISVIDGTGTWTQSQSTTVPSGQGFAKSLKMDCTTADGSLAATDMLVVQQRIEGQNLQYLKKGTSSAESLTASFWVRSNKTGTYICELRDKDNNRYISKSYTISSADTWEKKTLTYAGDTSGVLGNDNGASLYLTFWLAAGSNFSSGTLGTSWHTTGANRAVGQVNLADSTSNEWYITGVQLEAGTSASDFEFLPVDVNLQRCQRYYYSHVNGNNQNIANGFYYNASYITTTIFFPVEMRTAPSLVKTSGTSYYKAWSNNSYDLFDDFNDGIQSPTNYCAGMDASTAVGGTLGNGNRIITNNANALLAFNSEL